MDRVWVFDLDATLIKIDGLYGQAESTFSRLIAANFGGQSPCHNEIIRRLREIDLGLFEQWGTSRDRFPASLVKYYRELCGHACISPDEKTELLVWGIGESAFDPEKHHPDLLIPGVEETLDFLAYDRGDILFILTAGDRVVQKMKWNRCELFRWFSEDQLVVVRWEPRAGYSGDKTPALADLRNEYPDQRVFMVGDSISNDIVPAVRVGVRAVYVPPQRSWRPDLDKEALPGEAVVLEHIGQIIERYDEF